MESNSAIFIFASLLNKGQHLLLAEQFFPSTEIPFWKGLVAQGSKEEITKVVSLSKNGGKTWQYTHTQFNPIAPRKAKIIYNFGLSGCNWVKRLFIDFLSLQKNLHKVCRKGNFMKFLRLDRTE